MQDKKIVPSRFVWFHNVPVGMCDVDIKSNLETIYEGPVKNVLLINHPVHRRNAKKPPPKSRLAIVEFKLASTVTAVLKERKKWSNGSRIIARQTNKKSKSVYSELSLLRLNLNDDCLHTLCKYLSFWDVLNLAESSDQLWDFLVENVVPNFVRECKMFINNTQHEEYGIGLPLFRRALKFIGPQLTRLTLNGDLFRLAASQAYMQAVIQYCPALVSLCFYQFKMKNRFRLSGIRFDQLKDLHFVKCKYVGAGWIDLIGQLDGLESLALNDCLDNDYMDSSTDSSIQLRCSRLRKLSVFSDQGNRHSDFLMEAVYWNRATLRELYMCLDVDRYTLCPFEAMIFESYFKTDYYRRIAKYLPQLECLWVRSLHFDDDDEDDNTIWDETCIVNDLANLSKMKHLRKIIVDGEGPTTAWMQKLAQNPENSVEHLVLLNTTADMWLNACSFGTGIRVLDLSDIKEEDVLTFDHFTGLQTLVIRVTGFMVGALMAAIESCPVLAHVEVYHPFDKKVNLAMIVDTLRRKTETTSSTSMAMVQRTPLTMVVYDSFDNESCWEYRKAGEWRMANAGLLAANSDILTVVCKTTEYDVRRFDSTHPIDDYMVARLGSSPDYFS